MLKPLRLTVTAGVLLLVVGSAALSTRRVVGAQLRRTAYRAYVDGEILHSFELYDRARAWDAHAVGAFTDPADTSAYALTYRAEALEGTPELAPELAARGLALYVEALNRSAPGGWSWAGISHIYQNLRTFRPLLEEIDLSSLLDDPAESLRPEDRIAEAALLIALSFEPQNYFFLDSLGELYWSRGLREAALEPFRKAARIYPVLEGHYYISDHVADSPLLAGAVMEGLGQAHEAVPAREKWVVSREQGRLAESTGDLAAAASHYRRAIVQGPHAPDVELAALHFYLAMVQEKQGDADAAVTSLQAAIELQPLRPHLHMSLGRILGRNARHEDAMQAFAVARALDPANPSVFGAIATQCRRARDLDNAEKAYRELIRLDPDRVDPYLQIIDMFRTSEMYARAIPYARDLAARHPEETLYRTQLEQLYEDEVLR